MAGLPAIGIGGTRLESIDAVSMNPEYIVNKQVLKILLQNPIAQWIEN
jgi:hypothetical protein